MKKFYVLALVIIIGLGFFIFLPRISTAPTKEVIPAVATPVTGDVTLAAGQKGQVGDLSIVWNEPVLDSRCPKNAQCIRAGELIVNVSLSDKNGSKTTQISTGKPGYNFDGHLVTITSASPYPTVSQKISTKDYQITFHVAVNLPL